MSRFLDIICPVQSFLLNVYFLDVFFGRIFMQFETPQCHLRPLLRANSPTKVNFNQSKLNFTPSFSANDCDIGLHTQQLS